MARMYAVKGFISPPSENDGDNVDDGADGAKGDEVRFGYRRMTGWQVRVWPFERLKIVAHDLLYDLLGPCHFALLGSRSQ